MASDGIDGGSMVNSLFNKRLTKKLDDTRTHAEPTSHKLSEDEWNRSTLPAAVSTGHLFSAVRFVPLITFKTVAMVSPFLDEPVSARDINIHTFYNL